MIELTDVCKQYGSDERSAILSGVNLTIPAQSLAVVVGETGTGKSTLVKLLTAETTADSGSVSVFGRDLSRLRNSSITLLRRKIGILPQDLQLVENWTAIRNVALPLEIAGCYPREASARAAEFLGALNLASCADQKISQLSRGEKQRIALARSFVHEPWVVVLDEPTAHLDSIGVRQVSGLLAQCIGRGGVGFVTTNDSRLVSICLRQQHSVYRLVNGSLRTQHTPPFFAVSSPKTPNVVPFPVAAGDR